jgi:hypothetical protein
LEGSTVNIVCGQDKSQFRRGERGLRQAAQHYVQIGRIQV